MRRNNANAKNRRPLQSPLLPPPMLPSSQVTHRAAESLESSALQRVEQPSRIPRTMHLLHRPLHPPRSLTLNPPHNPPPRPPDRAHHCTNPCRNESPAYHSSKSPYSNATAA